MKRFANEFKTFINRGNVVDMSVGVIVGSAFTAIVTSVSNHILMPVINWLLSFLFRADSLSEIHTFLKRVYVVDETGLITEEIDLTQSIYINWGALLHAVLNFFLIALVLFTIVKIINKFRAEHREFTQKMAAKTLSNAERKELAAAGIKLRDKARVAAFLAEKKKREEEALARKKEEEEAAKKREREANPTAEDLLKQILAELQNKNGTI